ncbi:MAG TPA: FHA domain-containing protein [Bryobacteraceae bacterium]|jgi:hypothetical protein
MLVILEATAGPVTGRKIEIRAGTIVRIGRTPKSDYALGEDSYLSSLHFAVECDGTQCRIRDLGSSNGTFVNGERVTERVVHEGDSVVAGGSTFTIHVDATAATAAAPASRVTAAIPTATFPGLPKRGDPQPPLATGEVRLDWLGFSRSQSTLLSTLYKDDLRVCAVLDASRDSRIPAFLDASGEAYASLDPEMKVPAFAVDLPRESRLLDVLIKDGWSHGWGFYCAGTGFDEMCEHWRRYLTLRTEDGRILTFRFWDPRVLRALVPMMSAQESADFFGPAGRLVVEAEKAEIALEMTLTPRGARQRNVVLV